MVRVKWIGRRDGEGWKWGWLMPEWTYHGSTRTAAAAAAATRGRDGNWVQGESWGSFELRKPGSNMFTDLLTTY